MLRPEQAKQVLADCHVAVAEHYQLLAGATLPEQLRPIVYGILERDTHGQPIRDYRERANLQIASVARLDDLCHTDRLQVFGVFFPQIAPAIDLAWQHLFTLPYQLGNAPQQFRAPNRPDITATRRRKWFLSTLHILDGYHQDVLWLAHHAAYLNSGYQGDVLGILFAAVIDGDPIHGAAIFDILIASAQGEDEIGTMGRHIPAALLGAARPDGWEFIGKLLLAAQRQEGLRQIILEALDDAHPEALRHILHTVMQHDLARFSAVTLALNEWLGCTWDSAQKTAINHMLQCLLLLLEDREAREMALTQGSGEEVYLALWTLAVEDCNVAIERATSLITDASVERRCAAVHLLAGSLLPDAAPALVQVARDGDLRVVARALQGLASLPDKDAIAATLPIFEQIEAILPRIPQHAAPASPIIWEWLTPAVERERAANLLLDYLGERDPRRLLPHLAILGMYKRVHVAERLAVAGSREPQIRAALFALLRDRSTAVSMSMIKLLEQYPIEVAELPHLEELLKRKSTDMRRGLIDLMARQPDEIALASIDRLLAARDEQQRLAGLELLRRLHQNQRAPQACVERAATYRRSHVQLSANEAAALDPILNGEREQPTLANALGLTDPATCAAIPAPTVHPANWNFQQVLDQLIALDMLIHQHREQSYEMESYQGKVEVLLGANQWSFPQPDHTVPIAQDVARLPLAAIWQAWATDVMTASLGPVDAATAPQDGLHFMRMQLVLELLNAGDATLQAALPALFQVPAMLTPPKLQYSRTIGIICAWLTRLYPAANTADFLLNHLETALAIIPAEYLREPAPDEEQYAYRDWEPASQAIALARSYAADCDAVWTGDDWARLWLLLRWTMKLKRSGLHHQPTLHETLAAQRVGVATPADLYMQLLGSLVATRGRGFSDLRTLSARKPHHYFTQYPLLTSIYADCQRRILEVELQRGEMPTAATAAALSLCSISGADWLIRILQALGRSHLQRDHDSESKPYTLNHLLQASFPGPDDTPQTFAAQVAVAQLSPEQLLEAAVYAPQWAQLVEHALGWDAFADAVWWIHAHTRGTNWRVDRAIREIWEAQIGERTPLASADLDAGAVDVAWFQRVYGALGEAHWHMLYAAAKFASGGIGHARAQLFADAMLGRIEAPPVIARIQLKRHHDSVCALGLLPLPTRQREHAILQRYQVFQEFLRTSRKFGAMRRENESKAVRIGMENLARTAGYTDPIRLQWAMELQEVADLRTGPISVTHDGVTVTLRIDQLGQPHLDQSRQGRPLKQIPPRLKKEPAVIALRDRKHSLDQQRSRMRSALELAMCQEETFTAGELAHLLLHPILAPMLEQLVFVGAGMSGYLVADGQALRTHDGDDLPIAPKATLRIAHPYDLYRAGEWSQWQRECFVAERIQPFKQIFRELYVLTETEQVDGAISWRYAGQQIQPRQAMALLGQRGWIGGYNGEYGGTSRTFHKQGLTAAVSQLYGGGTSVDVEGMTIDGVMFNKAGEWRGHVPLAEVPPLVFSETMRDLDLVVSVAHRGGVDPETSASTVEMRSALIRETIALLSISNVRLQKNHALITGELGEYAVHLGSGVVHLVPGGALCIIPVHAQHQGRLFLPFADDDPKTAEIVSKILLLARDVAIKDPLILQQIYARA